ncbi:hypothetical protein Tco_0849121 [Tanacetum coccineum]
MVSVVQVRSTLHSYNASSHWAAGVVHDEMLFINENSQIRVVNEVYKLHILHEFYKGNICSVDRVRSNIDPLEEYTDNHIWQHVSRYTVMFPLTGISVANGAHDGSEPTETQQVLVHSARLKMEQTLFTVSLLALANKVLFIAYQKVAVKLPPAMLKDRRFGVIGNDDGNDDGNDSVRDSRRSRSLPYRDWERAYQIENRQGFGDPCISGSEDGRSFSNRFPFKFESGPTTIPFPHTSQPTPPAQTQSTNQIPPALGMVANSHAPVLGGRKLTPPVCIGICASEWLGE